MDAPQATPTPAAKSTRPAAPGSSAAASPNEAELRRWVAALASRSYYRRQRATEKLVAAGASAVGPLVQSLSADAKPTLESTTRVVEILSRIATTELPLDGPATRALGRVAQEPSSLAGARAAAALKGRVRLQQFQAIEALRRYGAAIDNLSLAYETRYQVRIDSDWEGGDDGIALLKWVPGLKQLDLINPPITNDSVKYLKNLVQLDGMRIFGTRIDPQLATTIKDGMKAEVRFEYRRGALLGITAGTHTEGCLVQSIQPGSAAARAGLEVGDAVVRFDGREFAGFEGLTALIGELRGGEKVEVEVLRDGKRLKLPVVMGRWR